MNFFFLFYLHGTFFLLLQTDSRSHTRVRVWNARRIHDTCGVCHSVTELYGRVWRCPRYCTVCPLVGDWLIIVGRTGCVVVLTAWVWRWVGHIVRWQLASLTWFFRSGICKWSEVEYEQGEGCQARLINLLQDCVSSSPLKSSLLESSSSVFDNVCLLCFILLFWNQTLTCDNKYSVRSMT